MQETAEITENERRSQAGKDMVGLRNGRRSFYGADSNMTEVKDGKEKRAWPKTYTKGSTDVELQIPKEKVLHPSWQAKKKIKETQISKSLDKPLGKKIRFN